MPDNSLVAYLNESIIPSYNHNDAAHDMRHFEAVAQMSLKLSSLQGADENIAYTVAAYHDCALNMGRELHHINSAAVLRNDKNLLRWFSPEIIELMAEAVEDHRASAKDKPRSIYGMIIADADREFNTQRVFERTIAYGRAHYPELNSEEQLERCYKHCREKYGENGYMHFYLRDASHDEEIVKLRALIDNKEKFMKECKGYL